MNKLYPHWEFQIPDDEYDYTRYWRELSDAALIDPVQSAADFYLLFAIANKSIIQFPKITILHPDEIVEDAIKLGLSSEEIDLRNQKYYLYMKDSPIVKLQDIVDRSNDLLNDLVHSLDRIFMDYACAAIGGELRHHANNTCLGKGSGYDNRFRAWTYWGAICQENGTSHHLFSEAESIFLDFPNSSYGGKPWANAAKLVHDRLLMKLAGSPSENQTVFIDRIFNLQHNTGSFLNKLTWANLRSPELGSIEKMQETVLRAHSSNPADLTVLYDNASSDVRKAVSKLLKIAVDSNINVNGIYEERIMSS
jgi:hypothetical protein